jgi:glycerol kinase
MKYILALDQGTTSSRAIVFDKKGAIKAMAQKEFGQIYPKPGWVEHDANEIWSSQLQVAKRALRKADLTAKDIAAIGITNQRETVVVWDRQTGEPICNAIVWQDRRTSKFCDELRDSGLSDMIQKSTGLVIDAYFSGTKLRWILKNVKGAKRLARDGRLAFGTVDTWLLWKLSDGKHHFTDATNASRTLLYNLKRGKWDDALLELFEVPPSMLPEIRCSSERYFETEVLGGRIPVAGIAGDQQAALFGQACSSPGMVKNTYGTGCFMLMHTGNRPKISNNNLLTTVAWKIGNETHYALEGSIFIAGAVTQWLRDGLGIIRKSADIEHLARSVPDNGGVYLVPAFAGLGAPHWDQYARGTIAGLTRGSSAGHIARAALEGIAYQVVDVVKAMEKEPGRPGDCSDGA